MSDAISPAGRSRQRRIVRGRETDLALRPVEVLALVDAGGARDADRPDGETGRRQQHAEREARDERTQAQPCEQMQRQHRDQRHAEPGRVRVGFDGGQSRDEGRHESGGRGKEAEVAPVLALPGENERRHDGAHRKRRNRDRGQRALGHQRNERLHLAHMREPDRPDGRIDHGVGTAQAGGWIARRQRRRPHRSRRRKQAGPQTRSLARAGGAPQAPSPPITTSATQLIAMASHTLRVQCAGADADEECRRPSSPRAPVRTVPQRCAPLRSTT